MEQRTSPPAAIASFAAAARFWVRLGFISFGGPAGQIAIMHREVVQQRRWLDERQFGDALNFCMLLPGPEALQLAIYLGWKLHGLRGGLVAGFAFIVPAIVLLLGLSWVYARFGAVPAVAGVLFGLQAAVVALVLQALVKIGRRALGSRLQRGTSRACKRWRGGSVCGWRRCWPWRQRSAPSRSGSGCSCSSLARRS